MLVLIFLVSYTYIEKMLYFLKFMLTMKHAKVKSDLKGIDSLMNSEGGIGLHH